MASRDNFKQANQRAKDLEARIPRAVSAHYDRKTGRIGVHLSSNLIVSFSPADVEGLEGARPDELKRIEISPSGFGIHFPTLDADLYVPGLLEGFLGSRAWMAARLGQMGGRSRSKGKAGCFQSEWKTWGQAQEGCRTVAVVCFRLQAIGGKANGSMFCAGPMSQSLRE